MATQNVNVGVNVSDNGTTAKTIKSVEALHNKLKEAQKTAGNINVGGTAGSRAVADKAVPSPSQQMSGQQYGQLRGSAGTTGASGRDFANQAQGLGGLVRVYATFAANIFAVSAAFEALNKAAQTERLIQSLDKLSVSAGANLKSVAKSLQEASGQALSFGEAVQFTNIGTTAGLAGKQIESLTKIARGAATVLGRDVGDSIRRIIQGTAKQEQEILDELGIFLKANQAYEKYAQAFNIKVDDLTAQQKTQAYANEVERLGQKFIEFAEIPDPFTRFTATGKDALNSLLSSINKAVVPVLELFASSEGAIKSMVGLISTILLRQALPQLATALTNLFTFDKAKINAEAIAANKVLEDKYIETTAKLHMLKKQREQLMVPSVTAETLGEAIGSSAYVRGKTGQTGLSVQRVSTALLKDDELAKVKKVEDVEKNISLVLKEQVRDSKNREAKLDALIQKGLISADSTIQEVKLGKESEEIAKRIFAQITAQNTALAEQLALEKAISATNKEKVALGKTISEAPKPKKSEFNPDAAAIDASAAASVKATAATQAETAVKAAQNVVLKESIGIRAAYSAGLGVAATAEAALTSAMAGGSVPILKATGAAMKAAVVETYALAAGKTVLAGAAIVAAGGIKTLSLGLKGLLATLNIIMVPIMLVITAWQLFGDKLLDLLPNTIKVALGMDDASKAAGKLAEKLKDVAEGAGLAGLAQERLNKAGKGANWSEEAAAAELQAKLIRDQIKAGEDLIKVREDEIKQLTIKQRKEEAASKGLVFSERAFNVEEISKAAVATEEQSKALKILAADWYELDTRRKTANLTDLQYNKEAIVLQQAQDVILKEIGKTTEQNAASTGKVKAATDTLVELSDKIAKKSKEVKNVALGLSDSDIVSWYEKIETLNNAVASSGTRVEDLQVIHDNLKKAVVGSTKAQEAAAPVIAILNSLMGTEDVATRAAAWEQLKGTVLSVTGSVAQALEASAKPKKIQEYSDQARTALIKFKSVVTDTGLELRRLDIEISNTQAINARKDALLGYSSEASIAAEKEQQDAKSALQYKNALAKAEEEYQRIILKRTATPEEKAAAGVAKSAQVSEAGLTKEASDLAAKIAFENKKTESAVIQSNKGYEQQTRLASEIVAKRQAELSLETTKLDILRQQGILTETQLADRTTALDALKAEAAFTQEKDVAELERQRALAELKIKAAAIPGGLASPEAVANELLIEQVYKNKIALATTANTLAKETNAINNENLQTQAKWNDLLKQADSLSISLGNVFKELGTSLGETVSQMVKLAQTQEAHDKNVLQAKAELAKFDDRDGGADKQKALADLAKAESMRTKATVDGYAATATSAKKMFKERTLAYKAFAAVEKTLHLISMGLKVKEMVQDGIGLASKMSNNAAGMLSDVAAAGVSATKAVITAIASMPFPANLAAGAATAVVVAGLISKIGGTFSSPKSSSASTPSSEQRVEVQGTGTSWDAQGNKVENGRGVFGDSSAKSESIAKSIEILKNNSVEGLSYDNKLLRAMERVADSITGAAETLYSIPGFRSSTMDTEGLGIGKTSDKGSVNEFLSDTFGKLGSMVGGAWNTVFGGDTSVTRDVKAAGLELSGTIMGLAKDAEGSIKQYTTVLEQWHEDGGLLGSDQDWTKENTSIGIASNKARAALSEIFANAVGVFTEVGKQAGMSSTDIKSILSTYDIGKIPVEIYNLQGQELLDALNAVVGQTLDGVAKAMFSQFDSFKKLGEGYLETVIRVTDTNKKITQSLKNVGIQLDPDKLLASAKSKITSSGGGFGSIAGGIMSSIRNAFIDADPTKAIKQESYEITEALAKAAGGLDKFLDQINYFTENFLSESEQINIARESVTNTLADLYLPTDLNSRQDFKALVQMQDLTTESGREMYQSLMDLAPAFYTATQRIEDLRSSTKNLEVELLKAQGNTAAANAALDAIATEGMSSAELAVYRYNKALQAQIDAATAAASKTTAISNERLSLEQKLYQVTNNIVALRKIELDKLDESNKSLQLQIWSIEDLTKSLSEVTAAIDKASQAIKTAESAVDAVRSKATDNYVAATQKVADAQQSIANLAIEAAKKMQAFGVSLRDFVSQQLLPKTSNTNITRQFAETVQSAMGGDTTAIEKVPEIAQAAIDAARTSAKSSQEFNASRAAILAKVIDVAKFAEEQAALTNIPAEEDPLVAANKALELALQEQTDALKVANSIGAALVKTPEDLIEQYKQANKDLAQAMADKLASEVAQRRMQDALDAISLNTKGLIASITGVDESTAALARLTDGGFNALDLNLDGKLTFAELQKALAGKATDEEIFRLMSSADTNADGIITALELETAKSVSSIVDTLGIGFTKLDLNLDGKLDFEELQAGLAGKATDAEILNLINKADSNADGLISVIELENAKSSNSIISTLGTGFAALDTNLDGKLTFSELQKGLAGKATDAEILALLSAVDTNGDKTISAIEVESYKNTKSINEILKGGFTELDSNLDGKLTYAELVTGLAGKATDAEIKALISAVDLNGDQVISKYELEIFNQTTSLVKVLELGFNALDTNLDGKVSSAEFLAGMNGKASDAVLQAIFKLIDTDNDKLISKAEITAAQSAISAANSSNISTNTSQTTQATTAVAYAQALGADQTAAAIGQLNNANLLTITNNTATTVRGINLLLDSNTALTNAINAVVINTKALADAVKAGSGSSGGGGGGSNFLTSIIGGAVSIVGGVVGAVGGVISSIGSGLKKLFSDERTKTNISLHSRLNNGIALYDYNYKSPYSEIYGADRKRGVLAQEVKDDYPEAVSVAKNGMYMVDYSMLPVPSDMLKFATGGVFSKAAEHFGATSFANTVVTKPTNFPIGLMGEAGPEAILPLTKTKGGRLGVVSSTGPDSSFSVELLNQNRILTEEVRALREEVGLLRNEAQATAMHTNKTTRILQRVTQNGDSLLITDTATL
jgi:Ca2+-binding EF-hand superfamily protein